MLSVLVKIEGDPLNTHHAQHRPVQATDSPCAIPVYSGAVAFIHITLRAPSRMGSRSVQIRRNHCSLGPRKNVCLLCECGKGVFGDVEINYILRMTRQYRGKIYGSLLPRHTRYPFYYRWHSHYHHHSPYPSPLPLPLPLPPLSLPITLPLPLPPPFHYPKPLPLPLPPINILTP